MTTEILKLCDKHPEALGKRAKDGRCSKCESERRTLYRATHREIDRAAAVARYAANPGKYNAMCAVYRANNLDTFRAGQAKYYATHAEEYKVRNATYYAANKDQIIAQNKAWAKVNSDKLRVTKAEWRAKNLDKVKVWSKAWKLRNPEKVKASAAALYAAMPTYEKERRAAWKKANPDKSAALAAKRRAIKHQATPTWANYFFISEAYHLANLRKELSGIVWHVDHIVPLKSQLVCGLHVHNNLQVIPGLENLKKYNSVWPDMPDTRVYSC